MYGRSICRKYGYYASIAMVVLLALAMVGCEQKTINQIKADPGRYANKEVAVVWDRGTKLFGARERRL